MTEEINWKATWLWIVECIGLGIAFHWVLNHPPGKRLAWDEPLYLPRFEMEIEAEGDVEIEIDDESTEEVPT